MLVTSLLWRSTVEFTYLKVKSIKCLCLLPVVLVLLFWSWSWSCKQWSWSWSCSFGLGLKNLVLFTSLLRFMWWSSVIMVHIAPLLESLCSCPSCRVVLQSGAVRPSICLSQSCPQFQNNAMLSSSSVAFYQCGRFPSSLTPAWSVLRQRL